MKAGMAPHENMNPANRGIKKQQQNLFGILFNQNSLGNREGRNPSSGWTEYLTRRFIIVSKLIHKSWLAGGGW